MENRGTSSDEIDLQQLFLKIVLIVKENFLLIASFFVIGTLLGFTYALIGPKSYESKMLVTSDILTESYTKELGDNLNDLIREGNTELLSTMLDLSQEEVSQVSSIDIAPVKKEGEINPSIEDRKQPFFLSIEVNVSNQDVLPKLQKGIIFYLEGSDFVRLRVEQKKKAYTELIKKTDNEIQALEKFSREIYDGSYFDKNKGGDIMFDPTELNSKIVSLTESKFMYEGKLEFANSIQVVEGFIKHLKPSSPTKSISLAAGATLGLVFVFAVIFFKSVGSLVRAAERTKKN
jgi:Chain length determinant protein